MEKGEFNLNFLEEGTREDPDPTYYRDYFVNYSPEKWEGDVSGGVFQFFADTGPEYTLQFSHSAEHGISLSYTADLNGKYEMLVTVGDPRRMSEIVDVGVDELRPVGSFLPPQEAWPIVEAFLRNPTEKPPSTKLVPIAEANWPKLYE